MKSKIRNYQSKDLDLVVALWKRCGLIRDWNDPIKDIARNISASKEAYNGILVVELDGNIIGSAVYGYDGHRGTVNYLAIDPYIQKCGIGNELMQEIEYRLRTVGCPKINIMVRKGNEDAENFFSKIDYIRDDVMVFGKRLIEDI